jgi:hypothetical protein
LPRGATIGAGDCDAEDTDVGASRSGRPSAAARWIETARTISKGVAMSPRLIMILVLLAGILLAPGTAAAVVHAGDVAPDFSKTDLDGNTQTLSQYQGKVVFMFLLGWS